MGFCGLDFGTSNSAISAGTGKTAPRLITLENGAVTMPSAMFFNLDTNETVFGRQAVSEYAQGYEGRLMRALKSLLGSELMNEATQVGNRKIGFRAIIGHFMADIKARAETEMDIALDAVVIGRPVRFHDTDDIADGRAEDDLRIIAQAQGFKDIEFEYEPLAAARDYESGIEKEQLVLVFDIGGGTSDFSVVRLSPNGRKKEDRAQDILANAGVHIGGTNFDQKLSMETVMKDLGYGTKLLSGLDMPRAPYVDFSTWHLINQMYTQKNISSIKSLLPVVVRRDLIERFIDVQADQRGHEIAGRVEEAKISLSSNATTAIDLNDMEEGWKIPVKSSALEKILFSDVGRIVQTARDTVKLAAVNDEDIDAIFMTGGSTGLPGFEKNIASAFPAAQIVRGDRFSSVAKGLGIAAAQKFG